MMGHLHGLDIEWYDDGVKSDERNYHYDVPHGKRTQWYSSGQLQRQCEYMRGYNVGEWKCWDSAGTLIEHVIYAPQIIVSKYQND